MKLLPISTAILVGFGAIANPVQAEKSQDIQLLKEQLAEIQKNYQTQIQQLESRIKQLEKLQQQKSPVPPPVQEQTRANAFNPSIALTLNGRYQTFSHDRGDNIPGFSLGAEAGNGSQGFSLGESELNLNSNIDDLLFGNITLAFEDENGDTAVAVEEAWIQTLTLPTDFTLKAGRFFSSIAYMNERHSHTDDFADRPLPYRAMLNGRYLDDGVQLRWLAPTDTFLEMGGELLRGAQYPAGGSSHNGVGSWSVFAHAGGDVGISNSWLAGLSYLSADLNERESGDEDNLDLFSGSSNLIIADLVWTWSPQGNPYRNNAVIQGGIFWRDESGRFAPSGSDWSSYDGSQSGWYAQVAYQFIPNWRFGLRASGLSADDVSAELAGSSLDNQGHDPWEASLMIDWSHSEFSRLRLQYTYDQAQLQSDDRFILQYIVSLGAHGAHQF